MIKAIITDVDGVMVGKEKGINFPLPHSDVMHVLQITADKGIPVILCSAKATYGILGIITKAYLANPHITNGGAIITDPLDKKILAKHVIEKNIVFEMLEFALKNDIFIELHTEENFLVQKNQAPHLAKKHGEIMQREPVELENLLAYSKENEIIKVLMITEDQRKMDLVNDLAKNLNEKITQIWTNHPTMYPAQFAIFTAYGVSKASAAKEVVENLKLSFDEVLGIGDTAGDWNFMSLCKYVAVVGDHDEKLIELAKTKGEGNFYCAPSVDDHGLLEAFAYFGLTKS